MYSIVYWPEMSIMCRIHPLKPHFFPTHMPEMWHWCGREQSLHISSRGYGIVHDLMYKHLEKLQNYACRQWLLKSIALFTQYFGQFLTHFCTYMPYLYRRGNELLNFWTFKQSASVGLSVCHESSVSDTCDHIYGGSAIHTLFPCQKYILSSLLHADYLIPDWWC